MKKFIVVLLFFITSFAYADNPNVIPIQIEPLADRISFSTVTLDGTNWTTAPTVMLRGRKEVLIQNTSTAHNVYLCSFTETSNTVTIEPTSSNVIIGTLFPMQHAKFKASSDLFIYISSNTAGVIVEVWECK